MPPSPQRCEATHFGEPYLWHGGRVQRDDLVRLRQARDRMDRDYAQPLDVPALAAEALMSVGHFQRSYKEAYGETPYAHLMTRRVERAAWLLRSGELSVTDVCMQVGCTSLGSFSARFTELMGETPSEYRARSHDERAGIPSCVTKQADRPTRSRSGSEKRRSVPGA
jgi:transcriptional regulator GlxA family with amidase domain